MPAAKKKTAKKAAPAAKKTIEKKPAAAAAAKAAAAEADVAEVPKGGVLIEVRLSLAALFFFVYVVNLSVWAKRKRSTT